MKQKFASFLLTGKAATLPFYAPSVLADDMLDVLASGEVCIAELPKDGIEVMRDVLCEGGVSAKITGCPGDAGTGPDVMNVVVTGLKPGDIVFLLSADDKDGFEWGDFRLGATNVVFLKSIMTQAPTDLDDHIKKWVEDNDFGYYVGGALAEGGSSSISIPVDLTKTPNPIGFNLQAVILRGDEVIFSDMDEISRDAQGETCPPAPEAVVTDPCDEGAMYSATGELCEVSPVDPCDEGAMYSATGELCEASPVDPCDEGAMYGATGELCEASPPVDPCDEGAMYGATGEPCDVPSTY